jgi:hypothetical protein
VSIGSPARHDHLADPSITADDVPLDLVLSIVYNALMLNITPTP